MCNIIKTDRLLTLVCSVILFTPFSVYLAKEALAACQSGRFHAGARETHASSDIIGVKGNITYRETELCNEGPPLNAENPWDNSAAWIGTHYFWQSGSKIVWAQTGWRRFNNETEINNSYVRERVYFEIGEYHVSPRVVNFKRTDKPNTIIPNKDEYKVELTDEDEGEWKAYLGGTYWHTFKDTYWENRQGNRLQASGEIHTETTDMPGVNSDRVEFSEVQWEHTLSGWQDSEFDGDDGEEILSGNPEDLRWGDNIVSATKVEIWDKDPN